MDNNIQIYIKKKITNVIEDLSPEEIVDIHNEYCGYNKTDEYISRMDYLEDTLRNIYYDSSLVDLIRDVKNGHFELDDKFFYLDGYGHFQSFCDPINSTNSPIDINAIVEYVLDNEVDLGSDDIQIALDEINEEFDEEFDL